MTCGIYEIVNRVNGKRYVGSSVDIRARWMTHLRELRKGTHHAQHLQRSFNKYGEDSFEMNTLLECDRDDLIDYEQIEMDEGYDYNSSPTAKNNLGFKLSEETKERYSLIKKKMYAEDESYRDHVNNMARGIPKSEEFKRKASERLLGTTHDESHVVNMAKARAELTKEQVLEVRTLRKEGLSLPDVSKTTGVSWGQCQRICAGERYRWAYNDEGPVFTDDEIREERSRLSSRPYNFTIYNFYHEVHGEVSCTQSDLKNRYNLRSSKVSAICSGDRKSHMGWMVKRDA